MRDIKTPPIKCRGRSFCSLPFWWVWGSTVVGCWGVWVSRRFTASSRLQRFRRCPFLGTPITPNVIVILLLPMTVSLFAVSGCEVKLDQQPVLIPSLVHPTFKRFALFPSLLPSLRLSSQFRRVAPRKVRFTPRFSISGLKPDKVLFTPLFTPCVCYRPPAPLTHTYCFFYTFTWVTLV